MNNNTLFKNSGSPINPAFQSSFKPAALLSNPHIQTLWATIIRCVPFVALHRERLYLPDGDFIDLAWTADASENLADRVVVILHGLEGSEHSRYVQGLMRVCARRGWCGVLMHFRGCSGEANRLARSYHAGDTADLTVVLDHVRNRQPSAEITAVGFSLGAAVLLKYLGEHRNDNDRLQPVLSRAAAISPPCVLSDTSRRINSGVARMYQASFLLSLRIKLSSKFTGQSTIPIPDGFDLASAVRSRSLWQFDELATAPLHGFARAQDYYRKSSCRQFLRHIRIPTL